MTESMRDKIITTGIAASQRRQAKLGDDLAVDVLGALVEAEGGVLVLDTRYNIKIVQGKEPAPTQQRPLTLAEEREVWRRLAIGGRQ
jgi:hypothetical protein